MNEPGVQAIAVAIENTDALPADNQRTLAVNVIQEIRVTLVEGKPGSAPMEGEADFLAMALSPFAFGGQDQSDAVRTTVVSEREWVSRTGKDAVDVVVFAGVRKPSQEIRRSLGDFVWGGGSGGFL